MTSSRNKHDYVYNPDQAADATLAVIEARAQSPHLRIQAPLTGFSGKLNTWGAGDLIGILGYTSHGKTTFLNYLLQQLALRIKSKKLADPSYNHAVLVVNYEQPIEELTARRFSLYTKLSVSEILSGTLSKEKMDLIRGVGAEGVRSMPLWLIGSSIMGDRIRVRPSLEDVTEAISWIEEQGVVLDCIAVDYLQLMPKPSGMETREGFVYNVGKVKDLTLRGPVILCSQAKRETQDYKTPIPNISDAMETSSFEFSCQVVFAVWRPYLNVPDRSKNYTKGNIQWNIRESLLIVKLLKQTLGAAPLEVGYDIDFSTGDLQDAPPIVIGDYAALKKAKESK